MPTDSALAVCKSSLAAKDKENEQQKITGTAKDRNINFTL
tara:strand:+ start:284 stop:403 length:120 start_codon:yes stop_codon:yes gene_type:complete